MPDAGYPSAGICDKVSDIQSNLRAGVKMKTYVYRVVVEPDEDRWVSYCPALAQYGAATWGYTEAEALKHIREVVEMVLTELVEDNLPIPEASAKH